MSRFMANPKTVDVTEITEASGSKSLHVEVVDEDGGRLVIDTGPLTDKFVMTYLKP